MSFAKPQVSEKLAMEAITDCYTMAGKIMTTLESRLWVIALEQHGSTALFNFAAYWASGSAQRGFTTQPPTIADLDAFLSPMDFDAQVALNHLRDVVKSVGHMLNPSGEDGKTLSPRMLHVIDILGGWVKVCETMPASGSVEWAVFAKNFASCWKAAEAKSQSGVKPPPALGLSSFESSKQMLLLSRAYILSGQSQEAAQDSPAPQ